MKVSRRAALPDTSFYSRTIAAQLHALGLIFFIIGGIYLIRAARPAGMENVLACWSFVITGCLVFATSATYHFLHDGFTVNKALEHLLETLDHSCIYVFIAGTYSPIVLNGVAPPWQMWLLILIWSVAFLGIAYTLLMPRLPRWMQHRAFYTGLFVLMGWMILLRIGELVRTLTGPPLLFLALGGLAYSLGALTYATKRPVLFKKYFGFHELWHLMVVLGAGCHYVSIRLLY